MLLNLGALHSRTLQLIALISALELTSIGIKDINKIGNTISMRKHSDVSAVFMILEFWGAEEPKII